MVLCDAGWGRSHCSACNAALWVDKSQFLAITLIL